MASVVGESVRRLSHMVEEHQAEMILPETWPAAMGYGPWVEEVWVNYLSNAIKYGGRPPRVELGATAQVDGMVRFLDTRQRSRSHSRGASPVVYSVHAA